MYCCLLLHVIWQYNAALEAMWIKYILFSHFSIEVVEVVYFVLHYKALIMSDQSDSR